MRCSSRSWQIPAPDVNLEVGAKSGVEQTARDHAGPRGRAARAPAASAARRRRCELDARGGPRRGAAAHSARPCRGRAAQRRPRHAGGDQPPRHRPARRSPARAPSATPRDNLHRRGRRAARDRLCRQCDDRFAAFRARARGPRRARDARRARMGADIRRRLSASSRCTAPPMSTIPTRSRRSSPRSRASRASLPLFFPAHPRTRAALARCGLDLRAPRTRLHHRPARLLSRRPSG